MAATDVEPWPSIPVVDWQDTRDTLHLYTQVVGKVRLANEPRLNHWWNIPLYVSARGLTMSLMPHPSGPAFQIDFDFLHHRLDITTVTGRRRSLDLGPRPVAEFYADTMSLLDDLGVATEIWPMPVEIPDAIPFPDDQMHATYDAEAVRQFWFALVEIQRVFKLFRTRFVGKSSPVHLFWGPSTWALTRFSGRTAPPHPGGAPNCGPHVMWEAYSHEVSSCGYWPGPPGEEGVFYNYAYPEPPGFRDTPITPDAARWEPDLAEFVLPYEFVRTAPDPDAPLLEFLQSTYEAAAAAADWNRPALERPNGEPVADTCTHLDTVRDVTPSSDACEDCLRIGSRWVHLRLCMHCGHVGCCDSSPNRHATAHWHAQPDHPLIRSYEPGEDWWWCYADDLFFDVDGAPPAPSHP